MYGNRIRDGLQVYITDSGAFDAITTSVAPPVTATRPYGSECGWQYPGRDPLGVEAVGWTVLTALARRTRSTSCISD
jgi:hypothetical protein